MEWKRLQVKIGVFVGLCTIVGIVLGVSSYFATSIDVEKTYTELQKTDALIAERMDIGITEDKIYRQQQQKTRIEDMIVTPRIQREPTDAEKEAIRAKEEEIKKLEKERDEKRRFYQEMRKAK